jgi:lipoprotein NlpI
MNRRIGFLACSLVFGATEAVAQPADATRDVPICENSNGQATPQERVEACSALLRSRSVMSPNQEAMTYVNRGWALSLQNATAKAAADYNRATTLAPGSWVIFNERGLFYLRTGQFNAAIEDYNTALKIMPSAAYPLYGRGLTWRRKGDAARSDADLAAARRADPKVDQIFDHIGLRP